MRRTVGCLSLTLFSTIAIAQDAPVHPWPPIFVLERQNEAACEIEKLIITGEERAGTDAAAVDEEATRRIAKEKARAEEVAREREKHTHEIETGMKRTEMSLNLPQIKVGWKATSIPTVHVSFKETKIPVQTIGRCTIGKADVPEFSGFNITMKTREITISCPKSKDVVLKVPQFKAGSTKIRLPEVTTYFKTTKIAFHVPQFRDRDWEDEQQKVDKRLADTQAWLTAALDEIARGEKARTYEAVRQALKRLLDKAHDEIDAARKEAMAPIVEARTQLENSRKEAMERTKQAGGEWDDADDTFAEVRDRLFSYERTISLEFEQQEAELNKVFNEMSTQYLSPVTNVIGYGPVCGPREPSTPSTY